LCFGIASIAAGHRLVGFFAVQRSLPGALHRSPAGAEVDEGEVKVLRIPKKWEANYHPHFQHVDSQTQELVFL